MDNNNSNMSTARNQVLQSALDVGRLRIGLPMWSNKAWLGQWFPSELHHDHPLTFYSHVFKSVEGNTSFYGIPDSKTIKQWYQASTADFRFLMKFPRTISHGPSKLVDNFRQQQDSVLRLVDGLEDRLGPLFLQCPGTLGPQQMDQFRFFLEAVKQLLPHQAVTIEVRHPQFFDRAEHEQALLRLCHDFDVSRTLFDSRGLFSDCCTSSQVLDAQKKKPRLPVHPTATASCQVVRFIGHSDFLKNTDYWQQWRQKIEQWLGENRKVYFFLHTAGNDNVYSCSQVLCQQWGIELPLPKAGSQPTLI